MFQLIISAIAIVLTVAIALATSSYTGGSLLAGSLASQGAAYLTAAEQVKGALTLYTTDEGISLVELDQRYDSLDHPLDNKAFMNDLIQGGYLKTYPKVPSDPKIPVDMVWNMNTWYNLDNDGRDNDWVLQVAGATPELCQWFNENGLRGAGQGPFFCDEWSVPGEPNPDDTNAPFYYHGLTYVLKQNP